MSEGPSPPEFHIDAAASRYIAENGGRVYIWTQAVGGSFATIKTSLSEPQLEGTTFIRYEPEGIEVYVEEGTPAALWRLSHHRFPRRHIRADNDVALAGVREGVQGGGP